ncbi:MAG: autotransporter domain-containing protein [Alphaproteobacteria bacterium]|nr:autotransporter domain-containing protein [Alphaproteobacteria bacterium]
MSKRALMLTAATAALLASPAMGDDFTDIKTEVTQQIKTSTAANGSPADILIESTGSVVVAVAGPAVEIDSPNTVTNQGTISNIGTTSAIGVQMDATAAGNGPGSDTTAFDSTGTIDLSGSGTTKTGILVGIANGDSTGIFNGGITLETGSNLKMAGDGAVALHIADNTTLNGTINLSGVMSLTGGIGMTGILLGSATAPATLVGDMTMSTGSTLSATGDNSIGIHLEPGSSIQGNLELDGIMTIAPTTATSLTNGDVFGIKVDNNTAGDAITGNVTIGTGASISATGANAQALVLLGGVGGSVTNDGTILSLGALNPASSTGNPTGSSAFVVANNVAGGILNNGPINPTDSTADAIIEGNGADIRPVFLISPTADDATPTSDIHIGVFPGLPEGAYSLVNRGKILAVEGNVDQLAATAVRIEGAGGFSTFLDGGFFSSGAISTSLTGDDSQASPVTVTGISIGAGGNLPIFYNSAQNSSAPGIVSATYSGTALGGAAYGIHIETGGTLSKIVNEGTITASAATTDTSISNLQAFAIQDDSGSLLEVDNSGTISAFATTLDNNSQVTTAIGMANATQDERIDNSGTIVGNVALGSGADTVLVHGLASQSATITGDIAFGGTSSGNGGDDYLQIDDFASVTGAVTERAGGRLDALVNPGGSLILTNDSIDLDKRFEVNNLTVGDGGVLGLSLSQTYNLSVNPTAGGIVTASGLVNLNPGAILDLPFKGFLSGQTPGEASQFILIDAPLNQLQLNLSALQTEVCPEVPFLFESTNSQCLAVQTTSDRSQLVLTLTPKTPEEIGLNGYALTMFPAANLALANDPELGSAVIEAGAPVNGVPLTPEQGQTLYQTIYSQFAPNVTGAARALAISITDQASGPVAARQRELRMYAGQPGDTTLWGQEFNLSLNQDADAGTIGYRDSGFGIVVGADTGDPANGRYGLALSFYSGDINEKQPQLSKTNTEWALLTGYTDWRGRGFFLDSQLSAGVGQLDGMRSINVDGVVRHAQGKRDTLLGAAGVSTGVILTTGSTVFTPVASVDGLWMRESAYTEHGGGDPNGGDAFDLAVNSQYYDSARGFLGAEVRQDLNLGDFYLQPQARAGYRYDFLANAPKVTASFASTPGTQFTLTGPDPAKGNIVLGGSIAATTGAWSVGLNYDYLRGNNGAVSQVGGLTLVGRI